MKHLALALLALFVLVPTASAQHRAFDLGLNAVWVDPTNSGSFNDLADPADIDFDGTIGYGVSANIFFGNHLSTEFAVSRVDPDTTIRRRAVTATGGNLRMTPITAVLQWHFAPNAFIDPYIGAGAAYVLFDNSDNNSISGINDINVKDDAGFAVNAGLSLRLGNRWGINGDVKYVPLESNATAVVATGGTATGKFNISPIIVSAGLQLRF
jgi:outer membrane protein